MSRRSAHAHRPPRGGQEGGEESVSQEQLANHMLDRAKDGDWTLVCQILAAHPDLINFKPQYRNFNLIHQAAYWNSAEAVTALFDRKADLQVRTNEGYLPIDVARSMGPDWNPVVVLLERLGHDRRCAAAAAALELPGPAAAAAADVNGARPFGYEPRNRSDARGVTSATSSRQAVLGGSHGRACENSRMPSAPTATCVMANGRDGLSMQESEHLLRCASGRSGDSADPAASGSAASASASVSAGGLEANDDWFMQLFGFRERSYLETKRLLEVVHAADGSPVIKSRRPENDAEYAVGTFTTPSLAELRSRGEDARPVFERILGGRLQVSNEVGDVSEKHALPDNQLATFQVASQFNCLEFVNPDCRPEDGVTGYVNDQTQGPACAISCGPATVYRNYFALVRHPVNGSYVEGQTEAVQINNLADVLAHLQPPGVHVRSGYTMASEPGMQRLNALLRSLSEDQLEVVRGLLRIGVQTDVQVTSYDWGARQVRDKRQLVTQVFASACSVAYCSETREESWELFATLVLEACYEATLWAATINAVRHQGELGSRRVFLTCVGGGVFGNETRWIDRAMKRALDKFQDVNLDVRIVSVGGVAPWLQALEAGPPFGASTASAAAASAQSACAATPSMAKVLLHFKEPVQLRYLYVDQDSNVHLLMPLAGGEEIGIDNTCKTVVEMQRFWGMSASANDTSAVQHLQFYLKELRFDLSLLELRQSDPACLEAFAHKSWRAKQLERYILVLRSVAQKAEMRTLVGSYPIFPDAACSMITQSSNMASMVLCPQHPDNVLRMPGVAFSTQRPHHDDMYGRAPFRDALFHIFEGCSPPNPLEKFVFNSSMSPSLCEADRPSESKFATLQEHLKRFLEIHGRIDVGFQCTSLQQLMEVSLIEFESMGEVLEWVSHLEDLSAPEVSLFCGVDDPYTISIMVQFFIGLANLHIYLYCQENQNWGRICDSRTRDAAFLLQIRSCIESPNPEGALLDFVVNSLVSDRITVPNIVKKKIQERFRVNWITVRDSPHFDEFMFLFKDLPGYGVCHQGCICVSFAEFVARSGFAPTDWMAEMQASWSNLKRMGGESLRHTNAEQVRELGTNCIELTEEELLAEIERRSPKDVAELLLANEGPEKVPLYVRFLDSSCSCHREPLKDWSKVKRCMLSMMPDQEALDAFSKYEASSHLWIRITSYIARSLYTEASSSLPNALEQLNSLSNEERPLKLHRALQLLGIPIEEENIQMSEFYDGYTVNVSLAQSELIRGIHTRQRQSFHLTQEMARAIYEQVGRRYGVHSRENAEMNSLNNWQMKEVSNPRYRRGNILAPPKMFRALSLLGIVIPRWEFNHYNGYIVRADAEVLDNLERELEQASQGAQETQIRERGSTQSASSASHSRRRRGAPAESLAAAEVLTPPSAPLSAAALPTTPTQHVEAQLPPHSRRAAAKAQPQQDALGGVWARMQGPEFL